VLELRQEAGSDAAGPHIINIGRPGCADEIQDAVQTAAVMSLWDETCTEYDIGSELLDQAMLAQAILCDEVAKLLA
jgi:hypothetical protein